MADQRFDEQEVGAILQRATEIQAEITPESRGMTLPELVKVASEVGIEPHVLERAAQEVRASGTKSSQASGARMFDQTVEGEISDEKWEDMVTVLRQYSGRPGTTTVRGDTREWTDGSDTGSLTLTATNRNGRTRLRMLLDTSGLEGIGWVLGSSVGLLGAIAAGVSSGKAGLGSMFATFAFIAALMLVGFVTHFVVRAWMRNATRSAAGLFDSLVAQVDSRASLPASGVPVEVEHSSEVKQMG